jgi:hypothetical protein
VEFRNSESRPKCSDFFIIFLNINLTFVFYYYYKLEESKGKNKNAAHIYTLRIHRKFRNRARDKEWKTNYVLALHVDTF